MKGASAVPCAKISSPTGSMVTMMGSGQHFFCTRMKAHKSLVMLGGREERARRVGLVMLGVENLPVIAECAR